MGKKIKDCLFYNFIWIAALVLVLTQPWKNLGRVETTLALEQDVRCGYTEHIHTVECYIGDVLICGQKAHTHSENCYLVRLADNDINKLLAMIGHTEEKSLTGVITSTVEQAAASLGDTQRPIDPENLDQGTIVTLNAAITKSDSAETVVLNPNLTTSTTAEDDTSPVEDAAGYYLYVYILADDHLMCIGNINLTFDGTYKYYCKTDDLLALYKNNNIVTDISAASLGGTHDVYYTQSEPSQNSDFKNRLSISGNISFGSRFSQITPPFHITVKQASGSSASPIAFSTVNLQYPDGTSKTYYVQSGKTITLDEAYQWYDQNDNLVTEITGGSAVTLTAKSQTAATAYTVTFNSNGGTTVGSQTVASGGRPTKPGDPSRSGYTFLGWSTDPAATTANYSFDESEAAVASDLTLYAVWAADVVSYTVTFESNGGSAVTSQTVDSGSTVSKPTDPTRDGYTFDGWYSDSELTTAYDFSTAVTGNLTLYAKWTADQTVDDTTTLTVSYDVNFSPSFNYWSGTFSETPTVVDGDITIKPGDIAVISDISDRMPVAQTTGHGASFDYPVYFTGWLTENGEILQPGANTSYENLLQYDTDGDGSVELTGQWDHGKTHTANFTINYYSTLTTGGGNKSDYTPSLFTTYVGGDVDTNYSVNGLTGDAAVEADKKVRGLTDKTKNTMWLNSIPSDANIFAQLQDLLSSGTTLEVDGETVKVEELNASYYTIRWGVMFYRSDDGWHIDGKLVKKKGTIDVTKEFLGDEAAIEEAEKIFYIVAQNGTKEGDIFTPYDSTNTNFKQYVLVLDSSVNLDALKTALKTAYSNATVISASKPEDQSHSYEWLIEDVTLNEYWQITEYPSAVTVGETDSDSTTYIYYAEYSIRDTGANSDGSNTAIAEYGEVASVVGRTYALDEDADQGLKVDFSNYYYPSDSLLIKKEDGDTGKPLGGAEFELWQYNSDGNLIQLKFEYDEATGLYTVDSSGTTSTISTGDSGYALIPITGFSFEYGNRIVIKEVTAPTGYDLAPYIEISQEDDGTLRIDSVYYDGKIVDPSDYSLYAEVSPEQTVLVVKDRNSDYVDVTVNKVWDNSSDAQALVKVVLQANGQRASSIFPTLTNAEVTLFQTNDGTYTENFGENWTYTWEGLPAYANGEKVTWSVKEILIGNEPTQSDSETFANWHYDVTQTSHTEATDNANESYTFQITNTRRRAQIKLTKVNATGAVLPGATFTLDHMVWNGAEWKATSTYTLTTDENGELRFDGLTAGGYYLLTETAAPAGYVATLTPIVLTVNGEGLIQQVELGSDGTVSVLALPDSGAITYTNSYNIRVVNNPSQPLPETGGPGTHLYMQSGLLFLMAAAALFIYKILHRKEEQGFS